MNLVDVRFFGCEGNVLANLVADIAEELVIDEVLYYCVLVAKYSIRQLRLGPGDWCIRLRFCVVICISIEHLAVKEAIAEVLVSLVVRNGSLLRCLAIGCRLVLALGHCYERNEKGVG